MAKKNKPAKKHRFKHTEPGTVTSSGQTAVTSQAATDQPITGSSTPARTQPVNKPAGALVASTVAGRDFSYVTHDLRRIGIFAGSLVVLELGLLYLLGNTGFGSMVYSLIKV